FKNFLGPQSRLREKPAFFLYKQAILSILGLLFLTNFNGCMTAPPLPKADLSAPGWTVRQGQTVWHPRKDAPEIAGELLVATRADGSSFVQFTKTPFPFAIAQTSPAGWQIEFPPQNKRFAAHGKPPARIVWFQLVAALNGRPVAKGWTWKNSDTNWQ